jgi:hypothetical protein
MEAPPAPAAPLEPDDDGVDDAIEISPSKWPSRRKKKKEDASDSFSAEETPKKKRSKKKYRLILSIPGFCVFVFFS